MTKYNHSLRRNSLGEIDVVVLCGGLGKRIRSEIGEQQKTMAQVHGRPFLDVLLKYLSLQGFRRIVLCTGYKGQDIKEYYKQNDWGLSILFSEEQEPLGTGGAIKNTVGLVQSDPFIALNGDCFCELDYQEFIEFYNEKKARASIVVAPKEDRSDFGSIVLDDSDKIVSFQEKISLEKTASNLANVGIYCFSKTIFSLMPKKKCFSIERDFFPKILDQKFFGFKVCQEFIDIGTPERYQEAQKKLRKVI